MQLDLRHHGEDEVVHKANQRMLQVVARLVVIGSVIAATLGGLIILLR